MQHLALIELYEVNQKLSKATNNLQRKFVLTILETQWCLVWRIFVSFAMESTFLNTFWKKRKEQKDKQQFQGQQMIKVLCLPSQEIISLSASPYLSLTAKKNWSDPVSGVLFLCVPPCNPLCLLACLDLTNGQRVKVIQWLLTLALDSFLPTQVHRYDTSYRSSFSFSY